MLVQRLELASYSFVGYNNKNTLIVERCGS